MAEMSFMEACLVGEMTKDDLKDQIFEWFCFGKVGEQLHSFLGLTRREYGLAMKTAGLLEMREENGELVFEWLVEGLWLPERALPESPFIEAIQNALPGIVSARRAAEQANG